jgi:hypothetical protein
MYIQYKWTREVYDEVSDDYSSEEMETELDVYLKLHKGKDYGLPENCYPDEWDIKIIDLNDILTDDELYKAYEWLCNQNLYELLESYDEY